MLRVDGGVPAGTALTAAGRWLLWALALSAATAQPALGGGDAASTPVERGRRMYQQGILPSGDAMTGVVLGQVELSGQQVICSYCHRRSGLGASEGQDVVPAVTGDILYAPLRLPTSKPPLPPALRPAYDDASLKRAIRDGIGADGEPLSALMPRYALSESDLGDLVAYLRVLDSRPDPGVDDTEINFATIVPDSVDAGAAEAYLAVFDAFLQQKNAETRNEPRRAAQAPWHRAWSLEAYRRWRLHRWDLQGPPSTWQAQLLRHYREQPVFAVLGGVGPGVDWRPIHEFCDAARLPCLFPTTDLPVADETSFYNLYLSRGMALEADAVAANLPQNDLRPTQVVQVYDPADDRSRVAASHLEKSLSSSGIGLRAVPVGAGAAATGASAAATGLGGRVAAALATDAPTALVLWLAAQPAGKLLRQLPPVPRVVAVYLSGTLWEGSWDHIPEQWRPRSRFVWTRALPAELPQLLRRSTGWLRAKKSYDPAHQRLQADAYFLLKIVGGALSVNRGFFVRDFLIERIERDVDNAIYTGVYPRVSLAPGQRFVSREALIAKVTDSGAMAAVTEWSNPERR